MNEKIKKQLENFFSKYEIINSKKGQILLRPGDKLNKVWIEKEGYIRAYCQGKDKKEISLPTLKPLFFCSVMSTLHKQENKYFIETVTAAQLWSAPVEDFLTFIKENPEIRQEIDHSLLDQLIDLNNSWLQIVAGEALNKVAGLICLIAKNRGEKKGNEIIINFNAPHRILATMTGLTRETVTLQILKLQKMGLLYNQDRKIVIRDMEKLNELGKM